MKKVYALIIASFFLGCIGQAPQEGGLKGKIVQKGSDTMVITAQRWAEVFMIKNSGVTIEISGGGSGTGIASLINGTTDLADASRSMKQKEFDDAKTNGREVLEMKAAIDGISLIVNPSSPLRNLTQAQLKDIFTGKTTNWKELGWEDHEIILYGRQSNSGTYAYFKEHVLKNEDYTNKVQELSGSAALADAVSKDRYGIAYLGVGYVKQRDDVRAISIDGIAPTSENILSGTYPISRYLFIYVDKAKMTPVLVTYLRWILSPDGQKIVGETGYDALPQNVINEELSKLPQ
jgi:phosphate transport system substrate-binding protein